MVAVALTGTEVSGHVFLIFGNLLQPLEEGSRT